MNRHACKLMLLLAMAVPAQALQKEVKSVDDVNLNLYAGRWYEQAHFPMYFQRRCASDTSAEYALRPDGTVAVTNACRTREGEIIRSRGVARKVDGSPSGLQVRFAPRWLSFLPFVWGDYWIIGLDREYQWAVVGTPDRKYLWILSRERKLDAQRLQQARNIALDQGFDVTRLVDTIQNEP